MDSVLLVRSRWGHKQFTGQPGELISRHGGDRQAGSLLGGMQREGEAVVRFCQGFLGLLLSSFYNVVTV